MTLCFHRCVWVALSPQPNLSMVLLSAVCGGLSLVSGYLYFGRCLQIGLVISCHIHYDLRSCLMHMSFHSLLFEYNGNHSCLDLHGPRTTVSGNAYNNNNKYNMCKFNSSSCLPVSLVVGLG